MFYMIALDINKVRMAGEVRSVVLERSASQGFGFSILGGSGSELPPIVYDIVDDSPASVSGQVSW